MTGDGVDCSSAACSRANPTPEKSKHHSFYIQNTSAEARANAYWLATACEPGGPDLLFGTFARPPTATWLLPLPIGLRLVAESKTESQTFPFLESKIYRKIKRQLAKKQGLVTAA